MYNLEEFESVIGGIAFTNLIIKYQDISNKLVKRSYKINEEDNDITVQVAYKDKTASF